MPRTLDELLTADESAWPQVQRWIAEATNHVEVLPPSERAGAELEAAQVAVRSPLGAIVYHTGGILIDHGWVRILGSGHARLPRSLMGWNAGRTVDYTGYARGHMLIADDVVGGFFALNGGALGVDAGNVYYFSPQTLRWEPTQLGYTAFVRFCLGGDLNGFYSASRWLGWNLESATIGGDQALSLHPPPWTPEGRDLSQSSRKPTPIDEVYGLNVVQLPRQRGDGA